MKTAQYRYPHSSHPFTHVLVSNGSSDMQKALQIEQQWQQQMFYLTSPEPLAWGRLNTFQRGQTFKSYRVAEGTFKLFPSCDSRCPPYSLYLMAKYQCSGNFRVASPSLTSNERTEDKDMEGTVQLVFRDPVLQLGERDPPVFYLASWWRVILIPNSMYWCHTEVMSSRQWYHTAAMWFGAAP